MPVRVEGLTGYRDQFGGLAADAMTSYAVRGYFENGGELAWIVRVCGVSALARASFSIPGSTDPTIYRVDATSPGTWANNGKVTIWYRPSSLADPKVDDVDVRVTVPGEPVEVFMRVPVAKITERLAESLLVRITLDNGSTDPKPPTPVSRSSSIELTLDGGVVAPPGLDDYLAAVTVLGDQPEVALVAVPDLGDHLPADLDGQSQQAVVTALLGVAASRLDQLVILDVPAGETPGAGDALAWAKTLPEDSALRRAGVAYYPGLLVADPLGGATAALRSIPPSGHVTGVISRLDRERGAFYAPANVVLDEAVDLDPVLTGPEQVAISGAGLNLLHCAPGRGLLVWGGRTLDPKNPYLTHRRLLHRLVRAVHRAADPLVFDVNGPELRLSLVRAVTSVLLAAFRAGALAGARPQDGFQVVCDDSNNPPGADPGQVVCEIAVAPAVPMEFIHLRLLVAPQGRLEVVEA